MFGDAHIQLRGFHHYVLVRLERHLDAWLARGFVVVPPERLFGAVFLAFDHGMPADRYEHVWTRLFPWTPPPSGWTPHSVPLALIRLAREPVPRLYVLERVIERGMMFESPKFESPPLPPRTTTDHYVVVEAVTDTEPPKPVPGLRFELLIADGEIKSAQTDAHGVARVERIQAGRVVIRVLDLDGALWTPCEGEASQPSGSNERPIVHVARHGECLSKIAARYGIDDWQRIWDHPSNGELRQQRQVPHLLLPGDEIAVPATRVHEIVRPTDATHRIVVTRAPAIFQAVVQDHNQRPFKHQPYELLLLEQPQEPRRNGTTDDRGAIIEHLPVETQRVEVRLVRLGLSWTFALSEMVATPGGGAQHRAGDSAAARMSVMAAQARLNALGFASGAVDGKLGPRTRAALALHRATGSEDVPASPEELEADLLRVLHESFLA